MKKFILILLVLIVAGSSVFAFDILSYPPPVEGNNIMIDLGLGIAHWGMRKDWKMKIPPITAVVEYALPVDVPISVGGFFAVSRYGWDFRDSHSAAYTYLTFAGRANWHWGFPVDWLDVYTGASLGYQYCTYTVSGPDASYYNSHNSWDYGGFYYAFQGGAHAYFTQNIGVGLELGYPVWAKVAFCLKF